MGVSCLPDLSEDLLKEKPLLAEGGTQVVKPGGFRIVLGEEGTTHPIRLPPLDELEYKDLLSIYLCHSVDDDLSGSSGHGGSADGASQSGDPLVGGAKDLGGSGQGDFEVVLGARIPLHEHVVGNGSQLHLDPPQIGPDVGVVIDVADEGSLAANGRSGRQDPASGGLGRGGPQLSRVAVMRHDRQMLARLTALLEESEQVIRVGIGEKTIGPVGRGFRPQADTDHVFKFGGE